VSKPAKKPAKKPQGAIEELTVVTVETLDVAYFFEDPDQAVRWAKNYGQDAMIIWAGPTISKETAAREMFRKPKPHGKKPKRAVKTSAEKAARMAGLSDSVSNHER